jgi:hypothetical protein
MLNLFFIKAVEYLCGWLYYILMGIFKNTPQKRYSRKNEVDFLVQNQARTEMYQQRLEKF